MGVVTVQEDKCISVEFAGRTSKFAYPDKDTFAKFLQAEDPAVQAALLQEIADSKDAIERKKRAEEEARKLVAEQRKGVTSLRKTIMSSKKKVPVSLERIPGKRMTFYVFQGSTYERASRGEYIWAPISNTEGHTKHYWDRLLDVRQGDIILHGCDGYVKAVSTARSECYECNQPDKMPDEDMWVQEGRRVDCDYIPIERPIKTSDFIDDILRLCNVKYAPFDKNGDGIPGYLFELNRELAGIFLRALSRKNLYLKEVDYIGELFAEDSDN